MSHLRPQNDLQKSCKKKTYNECIAEITMIIVIEYFIKNYILSIELNLGVAPTCMAFLKETIR